MCRQLSPTISTTKSHNNLLMGPHRGHIMGVKDKFEPNLDATKQTRYIFSLLGIWPMMTNDTTTMEKHISVVIRAFCQSVLAFIIIPGNMQLFYIRGLEIKLGYFGPLGVSISCSLKYLAIISRRNEIKECISQIERDYREVSNEDEKTIMLRNFDNGRKITTVCATVMYCGGILHQIMMPILPGSFVSIFDNSTERSLIYPVYGRMFNDQITPIYEIMYVIQFITGLIICTIEVASCHLSIFLICHVLGQNQMMISKLNTISDLQDCDEREVNQHFKEMLNFHQKILKFALNVEESLRTVCLTATLEALILICFAEYYSITAWQHDEILSAIIYLMIVQAFIGNFFIFCHVGEISKDQFQKTGEEVYMIEWCHLTRKNVKALTLIMLEMQHPPLITACGFMELSYSSFVSVIKTSAAYFNMLRMRMV